MMKTYILVVVGLFLIVASFFIGYSINKPDSTSIEVQNLQSQINFIQQQNNQLTKQVEELQKDNSDTDFLLEYASYSWPENRVNLTISNKKIILEETILGNFTIKSRNLSEEEWNTLTSFFVNSGIFDVKQSDLIPCQGQNCPADGGSAVLKINYGSKGVLLNTGSNIISQPTELDNVLNKILELREESLNKDVDILKNESPEDCTQKYIKLYPDILSHPFSYGIKIYFIKPLPYNDIEQFGEKYGIYVGGLSGSNNRGSYSGSLFTLLNEGDNLIEKFCYMKRNETVKEISFEGPFVG